MRKYLLILITLCLSLPVFAASIITSTVPDAQQVAKVRLSVFLFDIYDASLYTPNGQPSFQPPFALKLDYLRNIDGEDIADRSAEEMRLQERTDEVTLAGWHEQMRHIFPNVKKGDSITGVYKEETQCQFYKNDQFIGQVNDRQFCQMFFDIWFGEKTTAPKLRNQVLSQRQAAAIGQN